MGKTRAEIQKAYRERLKTKLGEEYHKKERERVRKDYVRSTLMSSSKRKENNERNKIRNIHRGGGGEGGGGRGGWYLNMRRVTMIQVAMLVI